MMLMSPMEAVPFGTSRLGQEGSFLSFLLLVFPFLQSSKTCKVYFFPYHHSVFVHLAKPNLFVPFVGDVPTPEISYFGSM